MILTYITIEFVFILKPTRCTNSGPANSVGIATEYELDGPETNPGGENFSARPDRPWGPPSLLYKGYRVFPGGKERTGRDATPHPFQCRGHGRVELYL